MIDASPRDAWLFSRVTALGQFRRDLPIDHARVPAPVDAAVRTA